MIQHDGIQQMSVAELKDEVIRLRNGIREHRDTTGDDRCWLDDLLLYKLLPGSLPESAELPPWEEMERLCRQFFENRQCSRCPHSIPPDAITDPAEWDKDLKHMLRDELYREALRLREAIRFHRDEHGKKRTAEDDEKLYTALPEKLPADTRLTGSAFLPSCRRFWKTRQGQHPQKLHEW